MAKGQMGKAIPEHTVVRIRELLQKEGVTVTMIALRLGISKSMIRNLSRSDKGYEHKTHSKTSASLFENEVGSNENTTFEELIQPTKSKASAGKLSSTIERKIIADLRGKMPFSIVAAKHGVKVADVDALNQRVNWLAYEDDPCVVKPCQLTESEYRCSIGPRIPANMMEQFQPHIDRSNAILQELLCVDLETADTIRKIITLHHIRHGVSNNSVLSPDEDKPLL